MTIDIKRARKVAEKTFGNRFQKADRDTIHEVSVLLLNALDELEQLQKWRGLIENHAPYQAAGATWEQRHREDQAELEKAQQWRTAIIDQLVCNWCLTEECENDPRRAVAQLMEFQIDQERGELKDELEQLKRGIERLERCIVIAPASPDGSWQAWIQGMAFKSDPLNFDTAAELITKLGETERMNQPSIKVTSIFGESRMELRYGENSITVSLTKAGVRQLIEELQAVLDMADDDEENTQ